MKSIEYIAGAEVHGKWFAVIQDLNQSPFFLKIFISLMQY